jgi:hypothetical protein
MRVPNAVPSTTPAVAVSTSGHMAAISFHWVAW